MLEREGIMKFVVYIVVFCLLFYMLLLSFDDRNRQFADNELNDMGKTFVGTGVKSYAETQNQMQEDANVLQAQEYHDTVLDVAIEAAKEELRQLDLKTIRLFKDIWSQTKSSAFQMAEDVAYLIYPPRVIKNPKRGFTSIHMQNERMLSAHNTLTEQNKDNIPVQSIKTNQDLYKKSIKDKPKSKK